jgi:elongation factor Ts
MKINIKKVKQLRNETLAGVMEARKALEEAKGDFGKAKEWLKKNSTARAKKKADRETGINKVFTYVHHDQTKGSLVTLACETDFVAKTDEFNRLGSDLAMQVVASGAENKSDLLSEVFIKDKNVSVKELINSVVAKLSENIELKNFKRS